MKPLKIDASKLEELIPALDSQTPTTGTPRTTDPNFPIFSIRPGEMVLAYIPRHLTIGKDGEETLNMDSPLLHSVEDGRYSRYRCTHGIDLGDNNGLCPWCDGRQEGYHLANTLINREFKKRGWSEDRKDEKATAVRREVYQTMPVDEARRHFTFPIVIIENLDPHDIRKARTPKVGEDGKVKYQTYWFTPSENQYAKVLDPLQNLSDIPDHPGGQFIILNYANTGKDANASENVKRREAGRNFSVSIIPNTDRDSWPALAAQLDKETVGWTQEKAIETVVANQFWPYEPSVAIVESLLDGLRIQVSASDNVISSPDSIASKMGISSSDTSETLVVDGEVDEPEEEVTYTEVADSQPSFG